MSSIDLQFYTVQLFFSILITDYPVFKANPLTNFSTWQSHKLNTKTKIKISVHLSLFLSVQLAISTNFSKRTQFYSNFYANYNYLSLILEIKTVRKKPAKDHEWLRISRVNWPGGGQLPEWKTESWVIIRQLFLSQWLMIGNFFILVRKL